MKCAILEISGHFIRCICCTWLRYTSFDRRINSINIQLIERQILYRIFVEAIESTTSFVSIDHICFFGIFDSDIGDDLYQFCIAQICHTTKFAWAKWTQCTWKSVDVSFVTCICYTIIIIGRTGYRTRMHDITKKIVRLDDELLSSWRSISQYTHTIWYHTVTTLCSIEQSRDFIARNTRFIFESIDVDILSHQILLKRSICTWT